MDPRSRAARLTQGAMVVKEAYLCSHNGRLRPKGSSSCSHQAQQNFLGANGNTPFNRACCSVRQPKQRPPRDIACSAQLAAVGGGLSPPEGDYKLICLDTGTGVLLGEQPDTLGCSSTAWAERSQSRTLPSAPPGGESRRLRGGRGVNPELAKLVLEVVGLGMTAVVLVLVALLLG
jgi:hypothetical protein